jgi:hypothetical protein
LQLLAVCGLVPWGVMSTDGLPQQHAVCLDVACCSCLAGNACRLCQGTQALHSH